MLYSKYKKGKDSLITKEIKSLCIIHEIWLIEINLWWQCCLNIYIYNPFNPSHLS